MRSTRIVECPFRTPLRIAGAFLLVLLPARAARPETSVGPDRESAVVVREQWRAGETSLPPTWRSMLRQVLRQAATTAGVVLCSDGERGATDPRYEPICSDPRAELAALTWTGNVEVTSGAGLDIVTVTLGLDIHSEQRRLRRTLKPGLVTLQRGVVLPPQTREDEREAALAQRLRSTLDESAGIRGWFHELDGAFPERVPLPPQPDWEKELSRIVELLGVGRLEDARRQSLDLLADPRLPVELLPRVEDLRRAAEARTHAATERASATREPADPPAHGSGEERRSPPGPSESPPGGLSDAGNGLLHAGSPPGTTDPIPSPPAHGEGGGAAIFDFTFRVRLAREGIGFRGGVSGRLRISERGLAFHPDDPRGPDSWVIPWSSLAGAKHAEGLWDAPYPLVIADAEGERYFIVELTQQNRYASGAEILSLVEQGRKRHAGGS